MNRLFRSGGAVSILAGAALCIALLGNGITREVPLGNLSGTVTMAENGKPLPGAQVTLRAQFDQDGVPRFRSFKVREDGRFTVSNLPAGEYTVEAFTRAHSLPETRVEVAEGRPTALELSLEPSEPYLELSANQHVFTPEEEPSVLIDGFIKEPEASLRIFRASPEQVIQAGGIREVFAPVGSYAQNPEAGLANFGNPVRTFDHKIEGRDSEGVFQDYVTLPALPSGIYWLEVRVGAKRKGTYLNVTRLSMVTKHVGAEVLSYTTDIATGKPAGNAKIGRGEAGALKEAAVSGSDGIARFKVPLTGESDEVLLVASNGADYAFVDFYRYGRTQAGAHRIFTYTDRPVYRPGDEVRFKGIVRRHAGDGYKLPQGGVVDVEVLDQQGDPIQKQKLALKGAGTFNGRFTFNREIPPGEYELVSAYGDTKQRHAISVSAYRKPEFTVKVKPVEKFYIRGDRVTATVECEYFFGGPVVGAKVRAYVSRSPYWSYGGEDEEFFAEDGSAGGEYVAEVEAVTDGSGKAVIEFDTKMEGDPERAETDFLYTINASVEEGDKYFDGSGSVRVTRGEFGLKTETNSYIIAPGQPFDVTVFAESHADSKPAAGRQVRVQVGQDVWTDNTFEFQQESSYSVTTGPDGKATLAISSAKGGSLVVKAIASDKRGNVIEDSAYVWVDSVGAEASGPTPEIKLQLDKKRYDVGETAKLLIQTGKPGGSALVTIEGEKIYSAKIVALNAKATTLTLPITANLAPNAFVSIAYVNEKRFMESTERLAVVAEQRKLDVSIQSDRPTYKPGETVTYTIKTATMGRPVSADVSLGVVDESIYAIKEDGTDILAGFYPLRENGVQTSFSFPELFLDGGDKSSADISVRSKFLDTAQWIPNITTDASGVATVEVELPDNLTSWRATAIAASPETAVGQATMNVKARKDLMIRLQTPSFLVQQDKQTITATVINDSRKQADVQIELQSDIPIAGDSRQTISISPGEPASLTWTAQASRTGIATFTAKAWIVGGDSDGVAMKVEVRPHARLNVDQSAGEIRGSEIIPLVLRPGADPNTGRMLITLSPSLASTLVRSLDGLIDYPYGCVEQTMSRFLPAILVDQTIKGMGLTLPRAKEIPAIVADGFQRLKNLQGSSGAWGWFSNDEGDPYMTAYVLEGIYRAKQAGYGKHSLDLDNATDWVVASLKDKKSKKWSRADRLYLIYVLALYGKADEARAFLGAENFDQPLASELAFALLARNALGDFPDALALKDRLIGAGIETASTLYWTETSYYGYETTGRALQALQTLDPNDPKLSKIVRFLMQVWKGESWMSTRDTAVILSSMSAYLGNRKEGTRNGNIDVLLNGRIVQRVSFTPQSIFDPALRVEVPISRLTNGENKLELRRTGGATCYYSVDLRQYLVREQLGQVIAGNGITVERNYYALEPQKLEDGSMRLMTSKEAIDEIESGNPVRVVIKIRSSKDHEFVMVEDPIPSNCRVMERGVPDDYDEWSWWYSEMAAYDDRVTFFARRLPRGVSTLEYTMRAESGGISSALPTVLSNMYDPRVRATGAENRLEVRAP
ncbi:MAG: DUF2012 domain-containing protein [Fimbriimonadaceae bacterium]